MNSNTPKTLMLFFIICLFSLSSLTALEAADKKRAVKNKAWKPLKGAEFKVYKSTKQGDLHLNIYKPEDWKPGDSRPVIVFFFGGGWTRTSWMFQFQVS